LLVVTGGGEQTSGLWLTVTYLLQPECQGGQKKGVHLSSSTGGRSCAQFQEPPNPQPGVSKHKGLEYCSTVRRNPQGRTEPGGTFRKPAFPSGPKQLASYSCFSNIVAGRHWEVHA
ncbi:hypothetical protein COCON_G00146720, partial [Conger conger]